MSATSPPPSDRQVELLGRAYRHLLERGLGGLSLRPLAAAIGSSPGVLMFLFGSKDGLIRALLARARADELAVLARIRDAEDGRGPRAAATAVWDWLAVLADVLPDGPAGEPDRTLLLAVLRGGLLDLLATGDVDRVGAAVHRHLAGLPDGRDREDPR